MTSVDHFASTDPACEGQRARACSATPHGPPEPPPAAAAAQLRRRRPTVTALPGRNARRVRYGGASRSPGACPDAHAPPGREVVILIGNRKPIVFGQAIAGPTALPPWVRPGKNRIFHASGHRRAPDPRAALQPWRDVQRRRDAARDQARAPRRSRAPSAAAARR